MHDLGKDPIINAVHNGIKRGIRVALEHDCLGSAVILILCGVDAMAYLDMPASQHDATRNDFVRWAEQYIKFPCNEQLTGLDLYGARCAMLHNYGTASDLSRKGKCRQVGYMDESVPEVRFDPNVSKDLVLVSVPALADAFFSGVDKFLVDLFAVKKKAPIAEQRLKKLVQAIPFKQAKTGAV
ncbi:MAG: hypothetical protein E6J89_06980 [Deltaproteobacteria bacterium]|nr:MAG: hypothetical protein E6J89_06980 [Deltaproteobacteria bacterium]